MTKARSCAFALAFFATVIGVACEDSGPESLNIAGSWIGPAAFGGTRPVTMRMALTQTGSAISGTVRGAGALPFNGVPVTGTLDIQGRTLTWVAFSGCEEWGGVLNIASSGTSMAGTLLVDRSGCQSQNSSATLTMTKE